MLARARVAVAAIALLSAPALAASGPSLVVTANRAMYFTGKEATFTASFVGGKDTEEWYCPKITWDFGDGSRSSHEEDCEPWTPETKIQRRFTHTHTYKGVDGVARVEVTIEKAGRVIAVKAIGVRVLYAAGQ